VPLALRFGLIAAVAALVLTACGDWNRGQGASVLDARVVRVLETGDRNPASTGMRQPFQRLELELESGLYRGEIVTVEWGGRRALDPNGFLSAGDRVLVTETREGGTRRYAIEEIVRLPALVPLATLLFVALVAVARLKGIAALAGLAASIAVFLLAIVPALQRGGDPLSATLVGAVGVVTVSVFVVHGANRKSLAALLGTLAGLVVICVVAVVGLATLRLTGQTAASTCRGSSWPASSSARWALWWTCASGRPRRRWSSPQWIQVWSPGSSTGRR
jgi:uncharacterized membrane protein